MTRPEFGRRCGRAASFLLALCLLAGCAGLQRPAGNGGNVEMYGVIDAGVRGTRSD